MLITEDKSNMNNNSNNNIHKIILISIVVLAIITVIILGLTIYLQSNVLKVYIDGVSTKIPTDMFLIDEQQGTIHISIKDFAKYANYEYFNGEYEPKSEDNTKCYVESENEVAVLNSNSNIIYKTLPINQPDYEKFSITEPVKMINNKLYTTPDGIQTAFNVSFTYNAGGSEIKIYTLPYLVQSYTSIAVNAGYSNISSGFKNQKSILYGMIVGERIPSDGNKQNSKFGVINLQGEEIIGKKYDNIEFIESTKEFFFTLLQKVGIITSKGENKLSQFDEIKLLDKDLRLYLVKNNDRYGVLDNNGQIVIHLDYNSIGINSSLFPSNNIKNNYILYDNCILVERNGLYGAYSKSGELLLPLEYSGFGCIAGTSKNQSINNLLVIPEYEGIVIAKSEGQESSKTTKYGIMNSLGKIIVPVSFDKIYSVTIGGNDEYYLETNGQIIDLEIYMKNTSQEGQNTQNDLDNNLNPEEVNQ